MTCYHFHTTGCQGPDHEFGLELSGVGEVRALAVQAVSEILRDKPDLFADDGDLSLIVTDETGLMLFTIDVVGISAPSVSRRAKGSH